MIRTEIGKAPLRGMTVTYYLVAENLPKIGVTYGIEVRTSRGEHICIRDISASVDAIRALLELMIRNAVTPVAAWDVVRDWLP